MKIKIFLLAFGIPTLFWLIILFAFGTNYRLLNLFIGIMIFMRWLIQIFIIDRKYLISFIVINDKIKVQYLTSSLKSRTIFLDTEDFSSIEFTKPNWLISYPATLNIKGKNGWIEFQLMNKNLKKRILNELAAFNTAL